MFQMEQVDGELLCNIIAAIIRDKSLVRKALVFCITGSRVCQETSWPSMEEHNLVDNDAARLQFQVLAIQEIAGEKNTSKAL